MLSQHTSPVHRSIWLPPPLRFTCSKRVPRVRRLPSPFERSLSAPVRPFPFLSDHMCFEVPYPTTSPKIAVAMAAAIIRPPMCATLNSSAMRADALPARQGATREGASMLLMVLV